MHTHCVTTRRWWGGNGKHEAPRKQTAHMTIGIVCDQVESKVYGAAKCLGGHCPRDDARRGGGGEGGDVVVPACA